VEYQFDDGFIEEEMKKKRPAAEIPTNEIAGEFQVIYTGTCPFIAFIAFIDCIHIPFRVSRRHCFAWLTFMGALRIPQSLVRLWRPAFVLTSLRWLTRKLYIPSCTGPLDLSNAMAREVFVGLIAPSFRTFIDLASLQANLPVIGFVHRV
jgi:hypothetical protein